MSRKQTDSLWLGGSVFFFLMLAVSFLLMPFEGKTPTNDLSIYTIVSGLMFWTSIVMGTVTQCVLAHRRKVWHKNHRVKCDKTIRKVGLLSFFSNTAAAVADVTAIAGLLGLIISMIVTEGSGYICYAFIAVFVFSFSMHCILNGRIFYYVVHQDQMLYVIEKERANSGKKERKEQND